ncbi:MAG TPA: SGNH/GDSL hydrolase family protein [Micromonosporaceae bacterium]|nr:SGNH/GDSL hydrolase family protein [Micromonosporaceae bacterium]
MSDAGDALPHPSGLTRRIAIATAYGGGGLGVIGALAAGLLYGQAEIARRNIPMAQSPAPRCDGRYRTDFTGTEIRLAVLGDSSAAGYGVERARDTTGALLAAGIAERVHRPVYVRCHAAVGALSAALDTQVRRALEHRPELTIILVGANDVTHRVRPSLAVRHLAAAVATLRDAGSEVVVCTCPDLGTIRPIPQPLRRLAQHWSRDMAAAQTVAAVAAGARTVSLGDLLGPQFASAPERMFGADRFHPSADGYAAAVAAILPTAVAALTAPVDEQPGLAIGEGLRSLTRAAVEAADRPGTEVSRAQVSGREHGPAGRWAQLRRRVHQFTERPQDPATDDPAVPLPVSGTAESAPVDGTS